MRRCSGAAALAAAVALTAPAAPLAAQLEPPSTGGAVELAHALGMLGHYRRVLVIGAHPDDEDTELLTVLARGMGVETAYLSLTRGEGGQNVIGPELGEALGLLRTEELLAARRLDGARQYFTRAYDFGYSKTLEETWRHWPRDSVLKDVVRIVRRFRPQILVSIFSGTPRDGHGQHQAAGWAAREGFGAAGDPTRFPELESEEGLRPWVPLKLYRSTRFDSAATTLTLDGAVLDRAVGKTYHQIAMAGRSRHRSQDMGQLQTLGPSRVRLALVEDRTGARAAGRGALFDGIDTGLGAMPWADPPDAGPADSLAARRERFAARIDSALRRPEPDDRTAELFERALADATLPVGPGVPARRSVELEDQLRHLESALANLRGVLADAYTGDARVVPGLPSEIELRAWNGGDRGADLAVRVHAPPGWRVDSALDSVRLGPGEVRSAVARVTVPAGWPVTTPYFLRAPLIGALYDWSRADPAERGLPFEPPPVWAEFRAGEGWALRREVTGRERDQALGEVRRPLVVVPRVDVKLAPDTLVWPIEDRRPRRFTVTLAQHGRERAAGTVRLELPPGWPPVAARPFELDREDETASLSFEVRPPARPAPGAFRIRAVATDAAGATYERGIRTVDYPHIRPRSYAEPAMALVRVARLALPRLARVGYVRGAADRVPEALRTAGVPVTLLDARALERGDLSRYDAIVIGSRAYETEPALGRNNARLIAYARGGGTLIVQYQQYDFFRRRYAPYPLTVGGRPLRLEEATGRPRAAGPPPSGGDTLGAASRRDTPGRTLARDTLGPAAADGSRSGPPVSHDRVTDETAPVVAVRPVHPVLLRPNRLGPEDWEGWVQERGLYFARTWDPAYRPVIETHDPGDSPLEGGLLVARVGRGTYVYTGLSFFRQLPAGVPGAFRLFANLLALAHAPPPR